jgi:hypothetical protein
MLSSCFFLPLLSTLTLQGYACDFAADLAGYNHVWFSSLLNTDTTVDARIDKAFTVSTNHASILCWQSQFGSHSDFSCNLNVTLRQLGFFSNLLLSQTKENMNALQRYLSSFIHLFAVPFKTPYLHQLFMELAFSPFN